MTPVGITPAQTAALAKAPGRLVVEVQTSPVTLTNVEVDAQSGRVLRVTSRLERSPFPTEVEAP
jgi:hypothetical protein